MIFRTTLYATVVESLRIGSTAEAASSVNPHRTVWSTWRSSEGKIVVYVDLCSKHVTCALHAAVGPSLPPLHATPSIWLSGLGKL